MAEKMSPPPPPPAVCGACGYDGHRQQGTWKIWEAVFALSGCCRRCGVHPEYLRGLADSQVWDEAARMVAVYGTEWGLSPEALHRTCTELRKRAALPGAQAEERTRAIIERIVGPLEDEEDDPRVELDAADYELLASLSDGDEP